MVTTLRRTQVVTTEQPEVKKTLQNWQQQIAQIMGYNLGQQVQIRGNRFAEEGPSMIKSQDDYQPSKQDSPDKLYKSGTSYKAEYAGIMGYAF